MIGRIIGFYFLVTCIKRIIHSSAAGCHPSNIANLYCHHPKQKCQRAFVKIIISARWNLIYSRYEANFEYFLITLMIFFFKTLLLRKIDIKISERNEDKNYGGTNASDYKRCCTWWMYSITNYYTSFFQEHD